MFATAAPDSGQLFHQVNGYPRLGLRFLPHCCLYATAKCDGGCSRLTTVLIIPETTSNSSYQHLKLTSRAHYISNRKTIKISSEERMGSAVKFSTA
jgi:hypothetical protein